MAERKKTVTCKVKNDKGERCGNTVEITFDEENEYWTGRCSKCNTNVGAVVTRVEQEQAVASWREPDEPQKKNKKRTGLLW